MLHASHIKDVIKTWLWENLHATLAEEKTSLTDLKKSRARFLGFELSAYRHHKMAYVNRGIRVLNKYKGHKRVLSKVAGQRIVCAPDRQDKG